MDSFKIWAQMLLKISLSVANVSTCFFIKMEELKASIESFSLAKLLICLRKCMYWAREVLMLFGWKYMACFQVATYILYQILQNTHTHTHTHTICEKTSTALFQRKSFLCWVKFYLPIQATFFHSMLQRRQLHRYMEVAAYILYPLCSTLEHRNEKNHKEHNKNNNEWNCYQKNRRLTVAFIYLELSRKQKKVKTDKTEKWKLRQLQNICDNICGKEVIEFSSSGNRTITDDSLNT